MKKNYSFLLLTLLYSMTCFGQGYHIQRYALSNPIYRTQDSVLFLVSGGPKKIAVVNPQTMDWKYVTSTDYSEYFTHLAFKSATSVVAVGSSTNLFYSEDNLQTFTKATPAAYGNMGVIKTRLCGTS
jgi:hypothetical protein